MNFSVPEWYKDGLNPWYVPGRFLMVGQGNNSFSLPKKVDRHSLEITPLKVGSLEDVRFGKNVSFQDYEGDEWLECVGIESGILCLDYPVPIYIFDNHNHVFYAWCEALKMGWFEKGATLVHMDEHFDASEPPFSIPTEVEESLSLVPPTDFSASSQPSSHSTPVEMIKLEAVWKYTNEVLQIATYIKPAMKLGIFSECVDFVESQHFQAPVGTRRGASLRGASQDVVLNLDIDVFHPDMSHISWQQKMDVLKYYLPQTKLITIATSPYFIDQQKAIQLVKRVVSELFA